MTNKKTKKEYFTELKKVISVSPYSNKEELISFLDKEIGLLSKKKENANQKKGEANNQILDIILKVLADFGQPVTITEMLTDERLKYYSDDKIMSPQRLTALCKKLIESKEVVRIEEKKKAYFSLNN